MIISFKNRIPIFLLFIGIVMVIGGVFITERAEKAFYNSVFRTEHTHEVILETQNVLSIIQGLQIGCSSYVITGNSVFPDPLNLSTDLTSTAIRKLRTLIVDNPYQIVRIDSVAQLMQLITGDINQYTTIRKEKGFSETSYALNNDKGKLHFDMIRHVLNRIQKAEYKLLQLQKAANQKSITTLHRIYIFILSTQSLFLVIIFFTVGYNIKANSAKDKTQSLYESIISTSDDAIISKDLQGIITSWNRGAENMFGYSTEEILGKSITILLPPHRLDEETEIISRIKQNKKITHYETERLRKNGSPIHISLSVSPIRDSAGNIIGASKIARDITQRKIDAEGLAKSEEKIRESEKIYKTIASSIPGSVICLLDKDYRYLLIEGDMLDSLGYSKEKLLGNKIKDVLTPERFAEILPDLLRVFKGESFTVEWTRENFDILSRFVPLKNETHDVIAAMIVVFDVSELKKAQRAIAELNIGLERKIKERTIELQMANKELEAFTYTVAHDLRTPLRALNGYATILAEDYYEKSDQESKRIIDAISYNAKKMGALIDDLLAFSKLGKQEIKKSLIDMRQVTELSLHDLNLEEGYHGKIKVNDLSIVCADLSLMRHVMVNLLSNAVKYSSKNESPVIEISSWKENEEIIHSIADNGVGFDMAYADKLFEVFQRLHSEREFEGTGVGLAIVQRIIHRHGGKIWAESKVDQGATFYFSLPITLIN